MGKKSDEVKTCKVMVREGFLHLEDRPLPQTTISSCLERSADFKTYVLTLKVWVDLNLREKRAFTIPEDLHFPNVEFEDNVPIIDGMKLENVLDWELRPSKENKNIIIMTLKIPVELV